MNWGMIGALGEFIGATAVVLTLFYLAHQVREASREAQRNRWSDLNHEISRVADSWGANTELSDIVFRGFTDRDSLQPQEVFRFYSSLFRLFRAWEAVFEYSGEGGIHQWGAQGFRTTMTDIPKHLIWSEKEGRARMVGEPGGGIYRRRRGYGRWLEGHGEPQNRLPARRR